MICLRRVRSSWLEMFMRKLKRGKPQWSVFTTLIDAPRITFIRNCKNIVNYTKRLITAENSLRSTRGKAEITPAQPSTDFRSRLDSFFISFTFASFFIASRGTTKCAEEQTTWIIYRMIIIIKTFHISTSRLEPLRGERQRNINRHVEVLCRTSVLQNQLLLLPLKHLKAFFSRRDNRA